MTIQSSFNEILLSEIFSGDVWSEMLRLRNGEGISIPQQFKNNGIDLIMFEEYLSEKFDGNIVRIYPNVNLDNFSIIM